MYLVIDLEATCWPDRRHNRGQNEIIEIGAVLLEEDFRLKDKFGMFVKPILHPQLSEFCQQLTSIRQEQVDNAQTLSDVWSVFEEWVIKKTHRRMSEQIFCSWGDYDKNQLQRDMKRHNMAYPFTAIPHRNLKAEFAKRHRISKCGMEKTLRILGLKLEGTHHRGIDDAWNIARILMKEWGNRTDI